MRVFVTPLPTPDNVAAGLEGQKLSIGRCASVHIEIEHSSQEVLCERDDRTGEIRIIISDDRADGARECVRSWLPEEVFHADQG